MDSRVCLEPAVRGLPHQVCPAGQKSNFTVGNGRAPRVGVGPFTVLVCGNLSLDVAGPREGHLEQPRWFPGSHGLARSQEVTSQQPWGRPGTDLAWALLARGQPQAAPPD